MDDSFLIRCRNMISPVPGPPSLDLEALFTGEGENQSQSADDLIPARMLNEFTYCPRLAYLEWVQGEFQDNIETKEGTFGHRNVDIPTKKSFDAPDENPDGSSHPAGEDSAVQELTADSLAARALMLSAPSEGLLAKLDLIELKGSKAVPIDYKRGHVPDVPHQAWEPERVQLAHHLHTTGTRSSALTKRGPIEASVPPSRNGLRALSSALIKRGPIEALRRRCPALSWPDGFRANQARLDFNTITTND